MINSIATDKQEIENISDSTGQNNIAYVGHYGVTKIVAYLEDYNEGVIPFIAVYKGDDVKCRYPAKDLAIFYK